MFSIIMLVLHLLTIGALIPPDLQSVVPDAQRADATITDTSADATGDSYAEQVDAPKAVVAPDVHIAKTIRGKRVRFVIRFVGPTTRVQIRTNRPGGGMDTSMINCVKDDTTQCASNNDALTPTGDGAWAFITQANPARVRAIAWGPGGRTVVTSSTPKRSR